MNRFPEVHENSYSLETGAAYCSYEIFINEPSYPFNSIDIEPNYLLEDQISSLGHIGSI